MAWYPKAIKKPITVDKGRLPMVRPVRINYHTAVTSASSLFSYFNVRGRSDSHFYVRDDGTVEQMVDTAMRANADLQGNPDTISIETWDGRGSSWKTGSVPPWTDAQVKSLIELTRWILQAHPTIPLRLARNSNTGSASHGLSWHRLGIDGNFPDTWPYWGRREGGLKYSNARGKLCPGEARISQVVSDIYTALQQGESAPVGPDPTPTPVEPQKPVLNVEWPKTNLAVDGQFGPYSKRAFQRLLKGIGRYTGPIDGDFGRTSTRALQTWLHGLGYRNSAVDGVWGKHTTRALQRFLKAKKLYTGSIDGDFGPFTIRALQGYLNNQAKFF